MNMNIVKDLFNELKSAGKFVVDELSHADSKTINADLKNVKQSTEKLIGDFSGVLDYIVHPEKDIVSIFNDFKTLNLDQAKKNLSNLEKQVNETVQSITGHDPSLLKQIEGELNEFVSIITVIADLVKDIKSHSLKDLVSDSKELKSESSTLIKKLTGSDIFSDILTDITETVKSILSAVDEIESNISTFTDTIKHIKQIFEKLAKGKIASEDEINQIKADLKKLEQVFSDLKNDVVNVIEKAKDLWTRIHGILTLL